MDNILLLAVPDVLSQESTLKQIMDNTLVTALNTKFGVIALISFIAALISAVFAVCSFVIGWRTMKAQISTENSTKGGKNVPSTQNLMLDMVRHLYRNLVVSYAIRERIRQKKYMAYPSEMHLKKMEVNLNNIDLHIFLERTEDYIALSRLHDLLRNYHSELEVIKDHLKDKTLKPEIKEVYLNVLLFKCEFLTKMIIETLTKIWPNSNRNFYNEAKTIIATTQTEQRSENDTDASIENIELNPSSYYLTKLFVDDPKFFIKHLNINVFVELGKDHLGCDRITMIDL